MPTANPTHILTSHTFQATPSDLWKAYSDPDLLAQWWGPRGFANTFETFEFREGGKWKFVMHGPDGTDYPNMSIFSRIVDNEYIEFEHMPQPHFHMIITFKMISDSETQVDWRMIFDNENIRDNVATYVIPANEENAERLEKALALM